MSKIVLLGDGGVGKTSFVRMLHDTGFDKRYVGTVGAEVHPNYINGRVVNFWDTAGLPQYMGNRETYLTGANVCILFFDLTHRKSYRSLQEHYALVMQHAPNARILVVGNKSDLPRVVADTTWATTNNLPYYEISAKTGDGMQQLRAAIVQML
jgi:small GTP-binding protein